MFKLFFKAFACLLLTLVFFSNSNAQCGLGSAIYVAPNATGTGTASSPAGLLAAISIYQADNSRNTVVMAGGNYYFYSSIQLPSGISITGGYSNNNGQWSKDPAQVTNLNVYPPFQYARVPDVVVGLPDNPHYDTVLVAHIIGLQLDSVRDVILSDLHLFVGNSGGVILPTRDGYSIYAIYAYKANNIQLRNLEIATGSAQNGGIGETGRNGYNAIWTQGGGLEIDVANTTNQEQPVYKIMEESGVRAAGGAGGFGGSVQRYIPCSGTACLSGGCMLESPAPTGQAGGGSSTVGGGAGGAAGDACSLDCYYESYSNYLGAGTAFDAVMTNSIPAPQVLSPVAHGGANGTDGADGVSYTGTGVVTEFGKFFVPGAGTRGQSGSGGSGGGGGGAGGIRTLHIPNPPPGADIYGEPLKAMQNTLQTIEFVANIAGEGETVCGGEVLNLSTRGGIGGGGGEGGEGGGGGGGGGGVYGIYAYQSNGIAAGNIIYNLGDAGTGGMGADGGDGGAGSPGLEGPPLDPYFYSVSNRGAMGGHGGHGGAGGHGQNGADGKKYTAWGLNDPLAFGIDTAHLCTNSVIGIAKGAQSSIQAFVNGSAAGVTVSTSPTYVEVTIPTPGTIHIIQSNTQNAGQYAFHDIVVTRQRPLPAFSVPAHLCVYDTLHLQPADTGLDGYRWRIYLVNGTLLKESREKTLSYFPPVKTDGTYYRVVLQTFEICCGWSVPVEHLFSIKGPADLSIAAITSTHPFCEGTDSVRLQLTGVPAVVTGTFPNYIYTYPGVTWNTGATEVDRIYAPQNGPYSVTYVSPEGCITQSPAYQVTNIWPRATSVPVLADVYNACDLQPLALWPQAPNTWAFNFYSSPTATGTLPGGYHTNNYTFQPFFGLGANLKDSIIIYMASVSEHGCAANQRSSVVIYHEKTPPDFLPPFNDHYYETAGTGCGQYVNYQVPTGADACSQYVVVNRISGQAPNTLFPVGFSTVVHRLTDGFGNYRDVTTYIEVRDATAPVITFVQPDAFLNAATGTCTAPFNLTPAAATDNCQGIIQPNVYWSGLATGDTLFGVGTTKYTYVFTDSAGNTTTANTSITVYDNQPPVLTCPPNQVHYLSGTDTAVYTGYNLPTVLDNCTAGGMHVNYVSGFGQFGYHPVGPTYETYSATDLAGNTGTCTFTIEVKDTIAPVVTCPGRQYFLTATGLSYATVTYPAPTAIDNLGGSVSIAQLSGKASGDTAGIGVYTAIWKGTDVYGNVGTCPVQIIVSDQQAPALVCPGNIVVGNDNGLCTATVTYNVAPALDNDLNYYNPVFSYGLTSGSAFPMGTTNVVYMVADAQNNRAYCSFNVTVKDTVAPVFTTACPNDTTVNINPFVCGANLPVPVLSGSDNSCFTPSVGLLSGSVSGYYELGTTTQQYRIRDNAGNSTTCTYHVTVVDNNTLTVTCPPNILRNNDPGQCTAYIPYYGSPVILPNYNGGPCVTAGYTTNPGPYFPVGTTQLTYNVNANGHTGSCFFTVTVVDNEMPHIVAPPNITVDVDAGNCGKTVNFTAPAGTDNCTNGLGTFLVSGLAPGSVFPIGTTVQTYVVSDVVSNTDTARFTITVRDTVSPVIIAPADITVSTNNMCGINISFQPPVGTDNSSCATTYKVAGLDSGALFPIGTTVQKYVVVDAAGLTDTCTFNIIINPSYPLQHTCIDNWLYPDPNGYGAVVYYPVPGVTDQITGIPNPCPGVEIILEQGQGSGAFFSPGPHPEQYAFVVKSTGDTIRCTTNVIVTEFVPPVVDCGSTQTYTLVPDSGACTVSFRLPVPTVSDGPNGGAVTLLHQVDFADDTSEVYTFTGGMHAVTFRAIDYSGNSSYCTYYVNVVDNVQIGNSFHGPIVYCENETVDIDPQLEGYATGLTYQWVTTDSLGAYFVYSTDSILHFDAVKPADQRQYSFRVIDRCGTATIANDFLLQVIPAAATTLSGLNGSYCVYDSADVTISFTPAGGILEGHGITGNRFNPAQAGAGTHNIIYRWYDNNTGCTGISTKTVEVYNRPATALFADSLYCINSAVVQLPAANSVYSGAGISGTAFNPAAAGGGIHVLTRTVTENGCSSVITQTVRINSAIPNATITAPASICEASGTYTLTAATAGGAWLGTYITVDSLSGNARFNSRASGARTDTVVYTITQSACTSSDTAIIEVRSKAYNLPYTFPEFCTTGPVVMFDTTDKRYIGAGFNSTNGLFNPAAVGYRGPIFYAVITTNNYGCVDTNYRMMHLRGGQLNVYPNRYVCEPGDTILVDLRNEFDSIRWWNGSMSNVMTFTDTGRYGVFLLDTMGCYGNDTLRINQYPVPVQIVSSTTAYACPSDSALIMADSTFTTYLWSTGDTTVSISVLPGSYTVTVTSRFGCQYQSPPVVVTTGPDAVPPVITCAADTDVYISAGSCTIAGLALPAPAAFDNCGLAQVSNNAPATYAVGPTSITWTATDNAGNNTTCAQNVTVHDTVAPQFTLTPVGSFVLDTAQNNCLSRIPDMLGQFAATDGCGAATLTQTPVAGTFAATGITTIQITATDAAGNRAFYYLYYQTNDTVAPVLNCPADITATAVGANTTAVVNYTAPAHAANCSNSTVQRIAGLGSGAAFPVGVTTERYVVTDGAGATDTCSFTVTVNHVTGITENNGAGKMLTIMPVPATDYVTIIYNNSAASSLHIKLMNAAGQLIAAEDIAPFNGSFNKTLDISRQPAGTFMVEITTESETITRKIIKL